MEEESKKSEKKAMGQESRGEERFVSCCGDGVVVDVGEGDGGGFRERRKRGRKVGGRREACLHRVHGATRAPLHLGQGQGWHGSGIFSSG